ncbi:hypothetical protein AYI69_g3399 [Smittium culicis]|uniref:Uncharacterized protein n=1 Tax=Smittium culicis TaxID=133412 RepID=A0A1R1YJU0_9FUNG|nr:hypothetical protein AYI69_g3399 [Smittium culicis]
MAASFASVYTSISEVSDPKLNVALRSSSGFKMSFCLALDSCSLPPRSPSTTLLRLLPPSDFGEIRDSIPACFDEVA